MIKTLNLTIEFANDVTDEEAVTHANAIVQNSRALGAHIVREENPVKGHGYHIAVELPKPAANPVEAPAANP